MKQKQSNNSGRALKGMSAGKPLSNSRYESAISCRRRLLILPPAFAEQRFLRSQSRHNGADRSPTPRAHLQRGYESR
jgi:hypothetical protein